MLILLLSSLFNLICFLSFFVAFPLFLENYILYSKMFWRAIVQTVTYAAVAAHFVVIT